ncbi:23S rRNA (adenine(2503)-C(2))-methyltransferase RlmN, partial [Turicibacter sanguinis]|nr:23S rRNA (adenine(2503)-C(2))-methyltransferase RlmN [Turicibacter sanguinis]
MEKKSIYSLDIQDWQNWLQEQKQPKFRANQIFDWLFKKRVTSIDEMSNLPKDLKGLMQESFDVTTLKERKKQVASDGTTKFLFELSDGDLIETVLMRHKYGCSVCVTTQVGCRIGCKFCASTLSGLKRNLQAGEIVAQVLRVQQYLDESQERVSHIVVMGIGEPFENYENLTKFIEIINSEKGLNIGSRHITVSTSGIVPKIYNFADQHPQVSFAVSLHAPTDELRTQLMPINRAYPLEKLMEAVKYYIKQTNRRITFEYGLIKNVNDTVECANQLADLVGRLNCHINLIPVN